jgi:hypothetical protein
MRKPTLMLLFLLFASVVARLGGIARAQPPYTTADFIGSYGFGVSGTVIFTPPPTGPTPNCAGWTAVSLPIAITGILTGDGKGGLTGSETLNAQGEICVGTLAGTYTVNSNGTGTLNNVVFTPDAGQPAACVSNVGNSAFTFSNKVGQIDLAGTDCFQVTSGNAIHQ